MNFIIEKSLQNKINTTSGNQSILLIGENAAGKTTFAEELKKENASLSLFGELMTSKDVDKYKKSGPVVAEIHPSTLVDFEDFEDYFLSNNSLILNCIKIDKTYTVCQYHL